MQYKNISNKNSKQCKGCVYFLNSILQIILLLRGITLGYILIIIAITLSVKTTDLPGPRSNDTVCKQARLKLYIPKILFREHISYKSYST